MIYREFQGKQLSMLGLGAMRLPVNGDVIDEVRTQEMVDYALAHGLNYFDTAYPYHNGESEGAIGRALAKHPRDSYYLADKYPGHQISSTGYNPAEIFEEQMKKCGVDYFDFYLLHNVNENSIKTYMDPQWGILDYFREQKKNGRIKHLGFSSHGAMDNLKEFLNYCGSDMEFCQIQLNYLDWSLQNAKEKYEYLTECGIPVWVMEPVRGGKLASLSEEQTARLRELRSDESTASWGFRFLMELPNVTMVLSGMSDMDQLADNLKTFSEQKPLTETERQYLFEIAESMKNSIPCTACRYCCEGCPMGLDIPMLLSLYNELRFAQSLNISMRIEGLPKEKLPSACIGCGKCSRSCPQNIDIPKALKEFDDAIQKMPSWAEVCRQREEEAKKKKEK